ncbi:trehalose-phosphatase [uncultured Georgenia sp.]|uniref:trehalose-phosphatase n=1 Tax=uncultured Georgenia sp. TaxID=378209 RepID=UPI00260AB23F|nr:trehalose-phosphatase [uncultured Georgenia sp.]
MTEPTGTDDPGVPGPGVDAPLFVRHLGEGLDRALRDLAALPSVLVALDFDGVLAPLVDDPATSRITPAAVEAIARLDDLPGIHIALISGRDADTLVSLAEVPAGTLVVGSHGAQRGHVGLSPDRTPYLVAQPLELTDAQARLRAEVLREATALTERYPGAWVETKPGSVVVHSRRCTPEDAAELTAAVLAGPAAREGLRVQEGKDVVEMAVVHATKGDAVAELRAEVSPQGVLFAGDDVTDEDAFAVLGPHDVGIKVGDGPTAAGYRVADPDEFTAVLLRLVELREQA